MAAGRECIYGCRHPLWGGEGACSAQADARDDECLCDEGYSTLDSFGNPSCVLSAGLFGLYVAMSVCGAAFAGLCQRAAIKHRLLPAAAQAIKRAALRLRLIRSASTVGGSASICFCVAAAYGNLYTSGMLLALYGTMMPLSIFTATQVMGLWVDTIPSQLIPLGGMAMRLKNLAEKQNIFVWVGGVASTSLMLVALLAFTPIFDTIAVVRNVNLMTGVVAACAALCVDLVGFYLIGLVNAAMDNAGSSGMAFYTQVLRELKIQLVALNVSSVVWCVSVALLEPQLAGVVARTPGIPLSIMVLDAFLGYSVAIHFGRIGPAKSARPSHPQVEPVSPVIAEPKASRGRSGLAAMMCDVVSFVKGSLGKDCVIKIAWLPKICPRSTPGEKRVVPTFADDR